MFSKIKITLILLAGILCLLAGCGEAGNISLEQALTLQEKKESDSEIGESASVPDDISPEDRQYVYVYVCGAVVKPGVYELEAGSRIAAALEAAGGFLPEASREAVNLAQQVQDGMQIVFPTVEEEIARETFSERQENGLVNLNTATVAELCTLSGIGEAKAEAILAYRAELGAFSSVEQLQEVSGIGAGLFSKIKDKVYIE